jgi:hypothetical protein
MGRSSTSSDASSTLSESTTVCSLAAKDIPATAVKDEAEGAYVSDDDDDDDSSIQQEKQKAHAAAAAAAAATTLSSSPTTQTEEQQQQRRRSKRKSLRHKARSVMSDIGRPPTKRQDAKDGVRTPTFNPGLGMMMGAALGRSGRI